MRAAAEERAPGLTWWQRLAFGLTVAGLWFVFHLVWDAVAGRDLRVLSAGLQSVFLGGVMGTIIGRKQWWNESPDAVNDAVNDAANDA